MTTVTQQVEKLEEQVNATSNKLNIDNLADELTKLKKQAQSPNFWSNNLSAQANLKKQAKLEAKVTPWQQLIKDLTDIKELSTTGDLSLNDDLEKQLSQAQNQFDLLKQQLKYSGSFDSNDVIISIHAGAGGTDAQDWADMLKRMYLRWAERKGFKAKIVDESAGDEAGIKSATFEIDGDIIYGQLKGEHGVHRLVRLSPFNADHLRQTSFAKVEIMPKIDQPSDIELEDKDLKIDVYRSSGKGGQSVNTTDSAVRITHLPTGVTVAIQNERSQLQNKETALTILRSKLAQLQLEQHKEHLGEIKGPNQSAEWGNQIRSYVLHPYKQVKDLRSGYETSETDKVLSGDLDHLIEAYLEHALSS